MFRMYFISFCLILDCSCSNNLAVSSTCIGAEAQPNALGDYTEVCQTPDDRKVYIHTNPARNLYIYYNSNQQVIHFAHQPNEN